MDKAPSPLKAAFILLAAAGTLLLLFELGGLVKLVVVAALFAYVLDPVTCRLE